MIEPYYQSDDGRVTLYCGDCLTVMPKVRASLIFADPPFNVGKRYGETGDNRSDYRNWTARWVCEAFDSLIEGGSFYHMTITRHLPMVFPIMDVHGEFVNLITWRNVGAVNDRTSYWRSYQPILFYRKAGQFVFDTYAQTREPEPQYLRWGKYKTEYKGQMLDHWADIPYVFAGSVHHPEAVLEKGTNKKAHPCQMPVGLAERAIVFSSTPDQVVLDPFMGSGTTGVACVKTGRRFIGIEISEEYCAIAKRRIVDAMAQGRLFGATP